MSRVKTIKSKDLEAWLEKHDLSNREFASICDVTDTAVKLWLTGDRGVSGTTAKVMRLLDKYPQLKQELINI